MSYLSEVQVVRQLAGVLGDLQVVAAVDVALCGGLGGAEEELVELRLVLDDEPGVGAGPVPHLKKRKYAFLFICHEICKSYTGPSYMLAIAW